MKTLPTILAAPAFVLLLLLASLSSPTDARAAEEFPSQEELETKFIEMLTNVKLLGTNTPLEGGAGLGEPGQDTYQIARVEKVDGETGQWKIVAVMKREGQSLEVPIPVVVRWAGDTAVMILDKVKMGGRENGPAYSARVLFHENTYAGTWSREGEQGQERSGLISGVIVPAE